MANTLFRKPLSEREIEIMIFRCYGDTNQEIADKLIISRRTVDGYMRNIYEKLGYKKITQLMMYAIVNEFIELDLSYKSPDTIIVYITHK